MFFVRCYNTGRLTAKVNREQGQERLPTCTARGMPSKCRGYWALRLRPPERPT